jgi:hypothetical protein
LKKIYARNSSPPDEVANVTPPVPLAVSTAPLDAAPEEILSVVTAPLARCVESILDAMMETVEVPDDVDTVAGEVPMTALT